MVKILSVLESKLGGYQLPEKAKNKLSILSDEQFIQIASLCDRIANTDAVTGNLALLLIAALIILP